MTDIPSHPYNIDELTVTDGSTTTRTGRSRKQSVKSVLYRVSKFLDGCELGSAYFVNFEELRLKMAILKMKMALLSLKKLKMALWAGTPCVCFATCSDCNYLGFIEFSTSLCLSLN